MANLSTKDKKIGSIVRQAVIITRPVHWVKNFALFAALLFTGTLFIPSYVNTVILAFIAFNLITSSTYIFNDIIDADLDRLHPIKKKRPIASKKLPVSFAVFEMIVLALSAFLLSASLNSLFFISVVAYFVLQIAYSLVLKNLPTIDILVIATGFIIRVYAGAFVINAHLSVWFLLCVISVALFLASGKRRAELSVIEESPEVTRKSLVRYRRELLNSYVTMFGNATWMSWSLFTFFESPQATLPVWLFLAELSKATTINKLLMITIPIVIFGIMRYESLIFQGRAEAPEKLLLTDKPLMASVITWTALIILILYGGLATGF